MSDQEKALIVLCTAPAKGEQALQLAKGLVEAQLAACVNIVPGVRSIYVWKGELNDDQEVQLLIKTRQSLFENVREWLIRNHPYEVPEIIALPVQAISEAYRDWLLAQTERGL